MQPKSVLTNRVYWSLSAMHPYTFVLFISHYGRFKLSQLLLFSKYFIKNLQNKSPITLPTNYSMKHHKDDNTMGNNRL